MQETCRIRQNLDIILCSTSPCKNTELSSPVVQYHDRVSYTENFNRVIIKIDVLGVLKRDSVAVENYKCSNVKQAEQMRTNLTYVLDYKYSRNMFL